MPLNKREEALTTLTSIYDKLEMDPRGLSKLRDDDLFGVLDALDYKWDEAKGWLKPRS